jgi:hypothetical protein
MTVVGVVALIVLVVLGILVLRVKSDPLEKESVRQYLADAKASDSAQVDQRGGHQRKER